MHISSVSVRICHRAPCRSMAVHMVCDLRARGAFVAVTQADTQAQCHPEAVTSSSWCTSPLNGDGVCWGIRLQNMHVYVWTHQIQPSNSNSTCLLVCRFWGRAEDVPGAAKVSALSAGQPGADLLAQGAAALAAVSLAFQQRDPVYSQELLDTAQSLYLQVGFMLAGDLCCSR